MEGYGGSHYQAGNARRDLPLGVASGFLFSIILFVGMALAQMLGGVKPPSNDFEETMIAMPAPEIEEIEEPEPPEPEEPEPEPELEQPPPDLTLEQLEIALNPGTGSLAGDFALPTFGADQADLGTSDLFDFSDLDSDPGLVNFRPNWPRRLLTRKVSGVVEFRVQLRSDGSVISAKVEQSNVPDAYADFLLQEISRARFTPPTVQGRPVECEGIIPIPVRIGT